MLLNKLQLVALNFPLVHVRTNEESVGAKQDPLIRVFRFALASSFLAIFFRLQRPKKNEKTEDYQRATRHLNQTFQRFFMQFIKLFQLKA